MENLRQPYNNHKRHVATFGIGNELIFQGLVLPRYDAMSTGKWDLTVRENAVFFPSGV